MLFFTQGYKYFHYGGHLHRVQADRRQAGLKARGCEASGTYGYITKSRRIGLGLPKPHANYAFVIAGGGERKRAGWVYLMRHVRKCDRKLYK